MDASIVREQASELLEAQAHLLNHQFSFISSMSLKCAVQLGIPDIIHKHGMPMTLQNLAASLHIQPGKLNFLHRLMRILTHSGYFSEQEIKYHDEDIKNQAKGYVLTTASRLLLKDSPFCAAPYLLFVLDPRIVRPCHHLSSWLQNGDVADPFIAANGAAIFEYARAIPELGKEFNDGMAADARLVGDLLTEEEFKGLFEGLDSLVDVGGGMGELAKTIAAAYPDLKCLVLDLPHVVDGLKGTSNLSYVAGNMFETIPYADAILLKWILHDWSDEECVKILKNCRKAITSKCSGGKVMVIDIVIEESHELLKVRETQLFYDMIMMNLTTGRERNEAEWQKLFLDAGFKTYKITPLPGYRSLIEIYP